MHNSTETDCPMGCFYRIEKGDTLQELAKCCGVTTDEFLSANPRLDPGYIEQGQTVILPNSVIHTVRANETLSDIMRRFEVGAVELRRLNPQTDILRLHEGDRLLFIRKRREGEYIIKENETLASVAKENGTSVTGILRMNPHLRPNEFLPGQSIIIARPEAYRGSIRGG